MDRVDLEHRHRTYDGWIPPTVAALLHEHGHHDILRHAAAHGDWFCARRLAEAAAESGPDGRAAALALLKPFAATGWWPAVDTVAGLFAEWEWYDEAIVLLRPLADTGHRYAQRDLARLLARQGRFDQVVALLGPRAADPLLAQELVELAAGQGHDAEIAVLLPGIRTGPDPSEPWSSDVVDTVPVHARFLELQGRIDEAIHLLGRHVCVDGVVYADHAEQLARLLGRHGREAELRAFPADGCEEYALAALARLLEEQDRIPEAVALLGKSAGAGNPHAAFGLAELLARQGRHCEAVEVLRTAAETAGGDRDWLIHLLCRILADAGQTDDALTWIDDHFARHGGDHREQAFMRAEVMKLSGRAADAEAEPAEFAGSDEELLRCGTVDSAIALAERLVRRGQPQKAVAHLRDRLDEARAVRG
ncbi:MULTISPECIES: tetratricopeptide repeat protein [Streptomyces]|uniref:Tetratricopeptide repeat protein n=1 Tax=Streptomyces eurythermus TaxID=42237 RepID=A0ABW6YTA7_9ACTN|nr:MULTISPECIES: tetratricopeptide repeat protein [Streptomyces]QIS68904.1 tetratricopeptide repeat protein [Streptomyces sp. DSM 40868]